LFIDLFELAKKKFSTEWQNAFNSILMQLPTPLGLLEPS